MKICLPTKKNRLGACAGFSLIELLIVISLFALVAVIVTVSYIGYETREQVKNAALGLKADIRLAQNSAKTGDKGTSSDICASTRTLAGWFVNVANGAGAYTVGGVCLRSNGVEGCTTVGGCETYIGPPRTVTLPTGVTFTSVKYNGSDVTVAGGANIFFRPTEYIASFHSSGVGTLPNFFNDTSGVFGNYLGNASDRHDLIVTLGATDGGSYEVKVTSFGGVEEKKL